MVVLRLCAKQENTNINYNVLGKFNVCFSNFLLQMF